jgi:sugar phosphate isomerase/epimerase
MSEIVAPTTTPRERFAVSQLMLPHTTFEEDIDTCADLGFGLGISEAKLPDLDDNVSVLAMREAGVPVGVCVPRVIGPLKDAWRGGPDDPRERVRGVCDGIARLAQFDPPLALIVTGAKALHPVFEARRIIVEGLAEIARFAAERDIPIGVEVLREESNGSLYNDLPRTFELLDEVGAENLSVVFDIWHLWDARDVFDQLRTYAPRISAVQLCDWRSETRWNGDRVLPGDGIANIPALIDVLESNGFTGIYDLEVFSDRSKEGSIWENREIRTVLQRSWEGFDSCWREAAGG